MEQERASGSVFLDSKQPTRIHSEIADEAMTSQKELELVRKSIDGCDDSFGKLYDLHKTRVHRHIYYMIGNTETAEDLASTTFVKAYEAIGRYKITGAPFVSWLLRIAHNQGVSYIRSKRELVPMRHGIEDRKNSWAQPESEAEINQDMERLRLAMLELKPAQHAAVSMKYFEGLGYKEIAAIQGKSVPAIRVDVFRGLKKLKYILGDINTIDIGDEGVA